jgi:hypothetical protein
LGAERSRFRFPARCEDNVDSVGAAGIGLTEEEGSTERRAAVRFPARCGDKVRSATGSLTVSARIAGYQKGAMTIRKGMKRRAVFILNMDLFSFPIRVNNTA